MEINLLYRGKFLQLLKHDRWEFAHRSGNVSAVGIVAATDDRKLILVEQFRIPVNTRTIELPAGLVGDDDSGEDILAAAARELLDETGYQAREWKYLYDGPSSAGLTDEMVHLVRALGLRKVGAGGGTAGEEITLHEIALAELEAFLSAKRSAGVLVDLKVRLAGMLLASEL